MDRSADPCSDFFRYSCGAWIKKNPIPPDQARWDVYGKLAEDNQRFLWGILERPPNPRPRAARWKPRSAIIITPAWMNRPWKRPAPRRSKPELDEIAAIKSVRELPAPFLAGQHLALLGDQMLFGFGSNQDFAGFIARHRLRQCGRTGPAGSRLLREDRRRNPKRRA